MITDDKIRAMRAEAEARHDDHLAQLCTMALGEWCGSSCSHGCVVRTDARHTIGEQEPARGVEVHELFDIGGES